MVNLWRTKPNVSRHFFELFTPQLFTMCMGTGILGLNLNQLPYQFRGLGVIADLFFGLDALLFVTFSALLLIRLLRFRRSARRVFTTDVLQTSFLATIPIAFGTLCELWMITAAPRWGHGAAIFGLILFALEVLLAVGAAVLCIMLVVGLEAPGVREIPPTLLYTSICCVTAGATGGSLASYAGFEADVTVPVATLSLMLIGLGLGLAVVLLSAYTTRLLSSSFPGGAHPATALLPMGPLGQGAYGLLACGGALSSGLASYDRGTFLLPAIGPVVHALAVVGALMLLGFAGFWFLLTLADVARQGLEMPLSVEVWALLFPLGVTTLALEHLGTVEFDSRAFKVVGTIGTCLVLLIWLYAMAITAWRSATGEAFGLAEIEEEKDEDARV